MSWFEACIVVCISKPAGSTSTCPQEVQRILAMVQKDVDVSKVVQQTVSRLPGIGRQAILAWSDRVLAS